MAGDGNILGKHPDRSVKAIDAMLQQATRLISLRAIGRAATLDQQKELFILELELDLVPGDAIQARAETWNLSDAEKALVTQKLVDVDVDAIMQSQRRGMGGYGAARAKLYEMAKAKVIPSRTTSGPFWQQVLEHASQERDGKLAQHAFDLLLQRYADEKTTWSELRMVEWQMQLEAAKAK